MCDSLCTEVGKSPLDIHHYRGRKNCNVLNVDNNGRTAKKRLAELVNALNLALTFGADQPMLYTYNSFYRKYSYIRILYFFFFFVYVVFPVLCRYRGNILLRKIQNLPKCRLTCALSYVRYIYFSNILPFTSIF